VDVAASTERALRLAWIFIQELFNFWIQYQYDSASEARRTQYYGTSGGLQNDSESRAPQIAGQGLCSFCFD
jgi:hypothetical protein